MSDLNPKDYKTISVEAAETGWIVREKGKVAQVCIRWGKVVNILEKELTTKAVPHDRATPEGT
jgi:hypothetical protein